MTHHLVGATEIATLLGVSRQRVHQLAAGDDFPKPTAVLSSSIIWEREAVEEWARQAGRLQGAVDNSALPGDQR